MILLTLDVSTDWKSNLSFFSFFFSPLLSVSSIFGKKWKLIFPEETDLQSHKKTESLKY